MPLTKKGFLLVCPDCHGAGYFPDVDPDEGKVSGAIECGWCEGSGYVYCTPCPHEEAPERPAPAFMRSYVGPAVKDGDPNGDFSDPFAED